MNSEQLDHFRLVYETHSYAAAARLVPMSAQGITKSVHVLERELGRPLFEPDDNGAPIPTEYGVELSEFAAVFQSNLRLLHEAFGRIDGSQIHDVRLGCSLGVMGQLGPDFLEGFHALRPDVRVSYWEMNDALCDAGLADGTYDLALGVLPAGDQFEARPLFECPVYFWVNADDPLARRGHITVDDLEGRDVALPGEGFKCYDALCKKTTERGITLGRVFQMSEIFHLYEFAAAGKGLGFTAQNQVNLSVFEHDDRVRAVPMEGGVWGFAIQRLRTRALAEHERALWDWCIAYCGTRE